MKKLISVVLVIVMAFSVVTVAFAAPDAALYNVYGDGMLFKQNEAAVIAGNATAGSRISAELYDAESRLVTKGESVADKSGVFSVSFDAPAGGYDVYTIILKINGIEFEVLENVLFGELWLASGQSNMQYSLSQEKTGIDMYEKNEKLSKWLRVLFVPPVTEYKGSTALVPCEPQKDIPGAQWFTGEDKLIYEMSAVAYFFATELTEEIGVPVGIINAPLGGSVISSWISRDAIDGDEKVKDILQSAGEYYEKDEWVESERSIYYDMTSNYNLKIEPLRHFRLSGMIWYQGESDIILNKTPEQYADMFDLMQRSYTDLFEYKNGLLPVVYTQLVAYQYHTENGADLIDMNMGFAQMQAQRADSRAVVSVYDVALSYNNVMGAIHPECKMQIGERMADSALGLVYGRYDTYTTATVRDYKINDGRIYVELNNAGDGLVCNGAELKGFAIAGADGIYVQADAEIVNENTVVIYNEKIEAPVSATYAYALGNIQANLYAGRDGKAVLPVSPFVVGKIEDSLYWYEKQWADCDAEKVWHLKDDVYTAEYSSWESKNATLEFVRDSESDGGCYLNITGTDGAFTVSPVLGARKGLANIKFNDEGYDYSSYGKITFKVRNNGNFDVTFDSLRIYVDTVGWYSPASSGIVIPADGEWYEIEVDINSLNLYGVDIGFMSSNDVLDDIEDIKFEFSGKNADISFDAVRFVPEDEADSKAAVTNIFNIANIFKLIPMFVRSVLEYIFG